MAVLPAVAGRTFRSLRVYNYRLFFAAQIVSMSGTWMQSVAQAWLVLEITGSSLDLGITVGLLFGPVLVIGPWAGALADRVDKRRLLLYTQSAAAVLALILGVLTATDVVTVWMIWLLAALTGSATALDMPSRQSFVYEMVGPDDLANAIGLNAVIINSSRIIGPAIGGVLIAGVGVAPCFFFNAASFLAVIVALLLMRSSELHPSAPVPRQPGQVRAGLRYVWRTPALRVPLVMMAVVSTLAYNFSVVLPLLAKYTYGRGGGAYGALSAAMGVGALAGRAAHGEQGQALATAARGQHLHLRRRHAGPGRRSRLPVCPGDHGAAGRRRGAVHQHHELVAAAQRAGSHAGPRDGPVVGRVPGQHAHRRPAHGRPGARLGRALGRRVRRRGRGADRPRRRRARCGARGSGQAAWKCRSACPTDPRPATAWPRASSSPPTGARTDRRAERPRRLRVVFESAPPLPM